MVGVMSAYFLARSGASVDLFGRHEVGVGSTRKAAGGIRTQFDHPANALSFGAIPPNLGANKVWARRHPRLAPFRVPDG
jgi:glycine/D-amino acid oxidase-like deaminating enzyme